MKKALINVFLLVTFIPVCALLIKANYALVGKINDLSAIGVCTVIFIAVTYIYIGIMNYNKD